MNKIELARKYMEIFYESKDFDSLDLILDEKLDFEGPLFKCKSAKEYIESLKASPPVDVSYEMVEEFHNPNSTCYMYRFTKNCRNTLMAQTFHYKVGRISKIRLVFNPEEIS
ncbi:hypothetical protein [Microbulbifer sp. JMSA003]|uniref:hypothetical protein n=1 Tax=unclassified Microbulbifer TaxID=2619833 RepID=UPI0040392630